MQGGHVPPQPATSIGPGIFLTSNPGPGKLDPIRAQSMPFHRDLPDSLLKNGFTATLPSS